MPLGGAATGLIGGLTGQQGALRSIFFLRSGLDGPQFVATGVVISILIDFARVPTYSATLATGSMPLSHHHMGLIALGTAGAFAGAWLGSCYLMNAKIRIVRIVVAAMLFSIGAALVLGLICS